MRDDNFWFLLFLSWIFFEVSCVFLGIGIALIYFPKDIPNLIGATIIFVLGFGVLGGLVYFIILEITYEETCLCNGETRKIHKANKKLKKLKCHKKYLEMKKKGIEIKQERQEEFSKLKCQIHNLELELKGKHTICEQCGAKIYRKACFCSQCGYNIKEVILSEP